MQAAPRLDAWLIGATHAALIAIPALFALDLCINPHMFVLPNFGPFARLGTEHEWAAALGAVCLASILGWRAVGQWFRCAALFALGTAHWAVALCFLQSGEFTPGTTTYPVIAALAWAFALRVRLAR